MTEEMEIRSATLLRADAETGIIEGIAVPWDTPTQIGGQYGFSESFARGSVSIVPGYTVKLGWNHVSIIGKVIASEDRAEGFWISAQISDTVEGRDARTLISDGVVDSFSVGFRPLETITDDETGAVTRVLVDLREVSATPFPAYVGATIDSIRSELHDHHARPTERETEAMPTETETVTRADIDEIRTGLEDLGRAVEAIPTAITPSAPAAADTRSAGAILAAIVAGDENTTRAYTGLTTGDTVEIPAWVGDLTRLIDAPAPLRAVFASGALPAKGMTVEYGVLDVDSSAADVQDNEGDNLVYGEVTVTTANADVVTVGGYSTLSRQAIERSSVNILDTNLRGQAIATGQALATELRNTYKAAVAAQVDALTATSHVELPAGALDYTDWLNVMVDAAGIFQDLGLSLDGLAVDKATFKSLLALEASDGRPVFLVTGAGTNNIGAANVKALSGSLANLTITLDTKLAAADVSFYNGDAIREYRSPIVRLQDDNIINLSKDFSIYTYVADAVEIPAGLVAVTVAGA